MKLLVLGAYGLIGQSVARALHAAGHDVTGLGRSARLGRALVPGIAWVEADLAQMTAPAQWAGLIAGLDGVVNCAGLLDAGRTEMDKVQHQSIAAAIAACEAQEVRRFIQISAPDAREDSSTEFFRSKARADQALKASALAWTIFRPGLVLAPTVYGGTSLVRMLAAFPLIQPVALADARIQIVAVDDVAAAVVQAVDGSAAKAAEGGDFDLVADPALALSDVIAATRRWLGFPAARWTLALPDALGFAAARMGDLAGLLGWRPALRTPGLQVLSANVVGEARAWEDLTGRRLKGLQAVLAARPSTQQDRIAARAGLIFPLLLVTLAGFFIATGVIALFQFDRAVAQLPASFALAPALVLGGALADIALGCLMLVRKTTRPALVGAAGLSLAYVIAGSVITPDLWTDPLGPLLKALPVIVLAIGLWAMAEPR